MVESLDDDWWLEEVDKEEEIGDYSPPPSKRSKSFQEIDESNTSQNDEKKKRKNKKKTLSQALAAQEPQAITSSVFLDAVLKHFQGKLSAVEMDEIQLEDSHFLSCAPLNCCMAEYMDDVLPKWKSLVKTQRQETGAPLVLVLCSAASRAVHLIRDIQKSFKEKCKVAKLFAKHMKIEEQKKYLENTVIQMGVGTPHRVNTLIKEGVLKLDQIQYVILDWSWRDQRLRQMISIPEIREELLLLFKQQLFRIIRQSSVKIGLV